MPDVASLSVAINADTTGLDRGLAEANQKVSGFGSQLQGAASLVTTAFAGIAAGAAAGVGAAVKSAADFEKQISAIAAVSGEGAEGMEKIRQAALQLGKDTSFSAQEAAAGMEEIIKAGLSVEQVIGGAGRAVLDLSAASGTAVEESARIMSNALNTFKADNMAAADAANILAGAANASATSVHELGFGLSSVGNVAATVGLSFKDTANALALFAQNGLKGSDAGTSLKTMLLNLQPSTENQVKVFQELGLLTFDTEKALAKLAAAGIQPVNTSSGALYDSLVRLANGVDQNAKITPKMYEAFNKSKDSLEVMKNAFFDANGNIKSMSELSETLQNSLEGMTQQQKIATLETMFGTDAIRAAAIMAKSGAEGFNEMAEATEKQGDVQRIAAERLDNVLGSWEKLKGSLETGAIMLGSVFLPAIKRALDGVTGFVNEAIEAFEQIPDAIATVKQVMAGEWASDESIRPFTRAVGEAAIMLRDQFGPAIQTVYEFVTGSLIPGIQAAAPAIAAFVAGFGGAIATLGLVTAAVTAVAAVLGFLLSPLGLVAIAVGALAVAWQTNFLGIQEHTAALWAYLQPILTELVAWLGEKIPVVLTWITTVGWPALVAAATAVSDWITTVAIPALTELVNWLGPKINDALTWITQTGWPALVAAATAVSDWITQTAIPALTELVTWIGEKTSAVVTWLTDTGWPGLVAAGQKVWEVVQEIVRFFRELYVELDKRQVFDTLAKLWGAVVIAGQKVWETIRKIDQIIRPFQAVTAEFNTGAGAVFLGLLGKLFTSGSDAAKGIDLVKVAAGAVADVIAAKIKPIQDFVKALNDLAKLIEAAKTWKLPDWIGGGGSGGGGGAQTLSWQGAGAANPNASQADVEQWAYQQAKARGWSDKDARELVTLISGEGAGHGARAVGDSGQSFGPLQLFTSGGLGNVAERAGINVRDPATWKQQVLFGMETIEREGAGQWSVAQSRNLLMRPPQRSGGATPAGLTTIRQTQQEWSRNAADANAICGPYLASLFAQAVGRPPTPEEARQIATKMGIYAGGITDASQFDEYATAVIRAMGGSATVKQYAVGSAAEASGLAQQVLGSGAPIVGFNTPAHYFGATAYDPARGFNVGGTGRSLKGGSDWMTIEQIAELGGGITAVIALAAQMGPAFAEASDAVGAATLQMGEAGAVLVTTSTDHMGNVMTIYSDATGVIGATITDAAGQIVNQWGMVASTVPVQAETMAAATVMSVTNMGAGILTTMTEVNGTTVATMTDMQGQVTSQIAQMANGAVLQANGMQEGVITSVTQMHDGTITSVQDMAGNVVVTVTDLQGNVTNQYTQMASSAEQTAQQTSDAFGEITSAAEEVPPAIKRMGDSWRNLPKPNVDAVVKELRKIEDAAEDVADAMRQVGGNKGGGSGRGNIFGKAAGGPVWGGETYLVGEAGPELFVPSSSGMIVPNDRLDRVTAGGSTTINVYGAGTEDVTSRVLAELRRREILDQMGAY